MRIEHIEVEGRPGHRATIRKADLSACDAQAGGLICADLARTDTTRTCDLPAALQRRHGAGDPETIRRFARDLHHSLEGFEGTCGDVAACEVILQHFAD